MDRRKHILRRHMFKNDFELSCMHESVKSTQESRLITARH